MANTISINGSFSLTSGASRAVGTLTDSLTLTGSNYTATGQNILSGSWSPLSTGSLNDFRYSFFQNADLTSSITIATGSGGQNVLAYLNPEDVYVLPWSGSVVPTLFAKATTNDSLLIYIVSEK